MTGMTEVHISFYLLPVLCFTQLHLGIRKGAAWYNTHLSLTRPPVRGQESVPLPPVVLLTDDVANRQKAEKDGIPCLSGITLW